MQLTNLMERCGLLPVNDDAAPIEFHPRNGETIRIVSRLVPGEMPVLVMASAPCADHSLPHNGMPSAD